MSALRSRMGKGEWKLLRTRKSCTLPHSRSWERTILLATSSECARAVSRARSQERRFCRRQPEPVQISRFCVCRELIADPNVLFIGYQIPHPLMHELKLRVRALPVLVERWFQLDLYPPFATCSDPLLRAQIHTTGKDRVSGKPCSPEDALNQSLQNLQEELSHLLGEFTVRSSGRDATATCLSVCLAGWPCARGHSSRRPVEGAVPNSIRVTRGRGSDSFCPGRIVIRFLRRRWTKRSAMRPCSAPERIFRARARESM